MPRLLAHRGVRLTLMWAVRSNGSHPAKEFYDELPEQIKRRFAVSFKKLGDMGVLRNREKFKIVEGTSFYEFKTDRYRIICRFTQGRLVLLTNGCEKKKDKLDPEDIRRAEQIWKEDQLASDEAHQGSRGQ
jgi:mRNA-degrading endonuclease RelE of RelBE toxin-antitoxin system